MQVLTKAEKAGAPPWPPLSKYEWLAMDLVDAYAGNEDALGRIIQHFRLERPLLWDRPPLEVRVARLRKAVSERLTGARGAAQAPDTLSLEDARTLIARAEGFAGWEELLRSYADHTAADHNT